jgi:hypothetical protein
MDNVKERADKEFADWEEWVMVKQILFPSDNEGSSAGLP